MIKKHRVIAFLLIFLILPVFAFGTSQRPASHDLIGHGSLLGDLFIPYAVHMDEDHYYALDMEGLTIFSREDQEAITKFRVDTGLPELISSFFMMLQRMTLVEDVDVFDEYFEGFDFNTLMHLANLDMFVDGNYAYIHSLNGIHRYDLETRRKVKTIPFPKPIDPDEGDFFLYHSPQYLDGVIYYLLMKDFDFDIDPFSSDFNPISEAYFLTYDLSTEETLINTLYFCEDLFISLIYGFTVAENGNISALAFTDNGIEIMLFDAMGNCLDTYPVMDFDSMDIEIPLDITFLEENHVAVSSFALVMNFETFTLDFQSKVQIFDTSLQQFEPYLVHSLSQENGLLPTRISGYKDDFLMIHTGPLNRLPDFSVNHWSVNWDSAEIELVQKIGKSPYDPGQVFGSFSFAVDDDGNLYHNNFMMNTIDVFGPDGDIVDVINVSESDYYMDIKEEEGLDLPVIITHLAIREKSLYVVLLWGDVLEYELDTGHWNFLHGNFELLFGAYACSEGFHVFNPEIMLGGVFKPNVTFIDPEGEKEVIQLDYTFFSKKGPDGFTMPLDFIANETEYHILDSFNNMILIFDREDGSLKETVKINRIFNFPTSFDFHPEEEVEWIVNDMRSQVILGVNRRGNVEYRVGGMGVLGARLTIEDYQARSNRFYAPIRLRVHDEHIYVLDFLNCRYHRITLMEP